ncbi:transcription antitermination factor NusB [Candidatus Nomurabacteria bacterium]|nr:transcription antitermination factor NusB [Candidatus Nomurabacteria bacterium]
MASRHQARGTALQALYQWDFKDKPSGVLPAIVEQVLLEFTPKAEKTDKPFVENIVHGVVEHLDEIDGLIEQYAKNYPIESITLVDRNILRIGVYEMLYSDEIPAKVAINEAIEVAKAYSGREAAKFVNGVLGALYKDKQLDS